MKKTTIESQVVTFAALPTLEKQQIQHIPVQDITASPLQPRKDFNADELEQLRESIAAHGIQIPLLGRRLDKDGNAVELIAGERRWRCAKELKLDTVPMIVRTLTDDDVLRIQRVENAGRENLKALEAAEDYLLLQSQGRTVDEIMTLHGVKRSSVFTRLRVAKLPESIKQLIRNGKLAITVADLVAKLPTAELQAKLAKQATQPDWQGQMPSFRDMQAVVEEDYTRNLMKAPWKLTATLTMVDGKTPRVLATCADCPLRSGNMPGAEGSTNICTDVTCYELKQAAHTQAVLDEAVKKGKKILPPERYQRESYKFDDAEDLPFQDQKHRSLGALAKAAGITPHVTVSREGKEMEVFTPEDKTKIFKHHKFSGFDPKAREAQKKATAEEAVARKNCVKLMEAVLPQVREKVVKLASTDKGQLALLKWLAADLDEHHLFDCDTREAVEKMPKLEAAWGLLALLVCENNVNNTSSNVPESLKDLCKLTGIDLKAEEKKLTTAPPETPKPTTKPAKAVKKGGRK